MSSKKSKIWEFFTALPSSSKSKSCKQVKCNKCLTILSNIDGCTSAMSKHLKTKHDIDIKNDAQEQINEPQPKKNKSMFDYCERQTMEEIVTELAVVDGLSIHAITNSKFIRSSIADRCGKSLPKCESDVMAMIHKNYETKKSELIKKFKNKLANNKRFSITLDEWTSLRMRRYVNINLHNDEEQSAFNLGLVRILGSCNAIQLVDKVNEHLKSFEINFETDIVASTSDGARVMIKYGRECPVIPQYCLNHAIHLAVCDILYKKRTSVVQIEIPSTSNSMNDNEFHDHNEADTDNFVAGDNFELFFDESEPEVAGEIVESIEGIRSIVKFFRKSAIRNNILQEKIKNDLKHEVQLVLDVKTRWNSMADMVNTFLRILNHVESSLSELNSSNMLDKINLRLVQNLNDILKPIKLTVEALSRRDATLITANFAIEFLKSKLLSIDDTLSSDFLNALTLRINERWNTELMALINCLRNPNEKINKQILDLASNLLKRLFLINASSIENEECDEEVAVSGNTTNTTENELELFLQKAYENPTPIEEYGKLRQEFALFKATGKRTENLQRLYAVICTIKPTSTDSERVFSNSSAFCTKVRSRLSDKSLNALVFLKSYYLHQK